MTPTICCRSSSIWLSDRIWQATLHSGPILGQKVYHNSYSKVIWQLSSDRPSFAWNESQAFSDGRHKKKWRHPTNAEFIILFMRYRSKSHLKHSRSCNAFLKGILGNNGPLWLCPSFNHSTKWYVLLFSKQKSDTNYTVIDSKVAARMSPLASGRKTNRLQVALILIRRHQIRAGYAFTWINVVSPHIKPLLTCTCWKFKLKVITRFRTKYLHNFRYVVRQCDLIFKNRLNISMKSIEIRTAQ